MSEQAHDNNQNPLDPMGIDSLAKNKKFVETVKIFAIYGIILAVANFVIDYLIFSLIWSSYYYRGLPLFEIIPVIIAGAVGGAIFGIIFFFVYAPIRNWIKGNKFVSTYINSLYTLFWVPMLVVTVLDAVSEVLRPFGFWSVGLIAIIIALVARLAVYYYYAKAISTKLSHFYPW